MLTKKHFKQMATIIAQSHKTEAIYNAGEALEELREALPIFLFYCNDLFDYDKFHDEIERLSTPKTLQKHS